MKILEYVKMYKEVSNLIHISFMDYCRYFVKVYSIEDIKIKSFLRDFYSYSSAVYTCHERLKDLRLSDAYIDRDKAFVRLYKSLASRRCKQIAAAKKAKKVGGITRVK